MSFDKSCIKAKFKNQICRVWGKKQLIQFKSVLFCRIWVLLNNTYSSISIQKTFLSILQCDLSIINLITFLTFSLKHMWVLGEIISLHLLSLAGLADSFIGDCSQFDSCNGCISGDPALNLTRCVWQSCNDGKETHVAYELNEFSCAMSPLFVRTHMYRGSHRRTCDPSHREPSQEQPGELFKHRHTRCYSCRPHWHQS